MTDYPFFCKCFLILRNFKIRTVKPQAESWKREKIFGGES